MIGGNIKGVFQVKTTTTNAIGEHVEAWVDVQTLKGWLDLSGGEARYNAYQAKIQDSSHIFICDYVPLDSRITDENSRMVINGKRYDVKLIDNPMELNAHLEIYLKFTGGQ
jgi:head-tail adaptor